MTFIAGALIIGAGVAATGAVVASNKQAGAAKQAGEYARDASQESIAEQKRQYDQTRQDYLPIQQAGNRARSIQEQMLYGSAFQPASNQPQYSAYPSNGGGYPNTGNVTIGSQGPTTYRGVGGFGGEGSYGGYGSLAEQINDTINRRYNPNTYTQPTQYNPGTVDMGGGQTFIPGNVNTPSRDYESRQAPQVPTELLQGYGEFQAPDYSLEAFQASPGYQFLQDEAARAVSAQNSAQGSRFSGKYDRELSRYATGLASQEYGNWYNRTRSTAQDGWDNQLRGYDVTSGIYDKEYQAFLGEYGRDASEFADYYNRLGGLSGSGNTATSDLATLGANSVANQSSTRLSGASNYGNSIIAGGAASAAGTVGVANAVNFGLGQYAQAGFPGFGGGGSSVQPIGYGYNVNDGVT